MPARCSGLRDGRRFAEGALQAIPGGALPSNTGPRPPASDYSTKSGAEGVKWLRREMKTPRRGRVVPRIDLPGADRPLGSGAPVAASPNERTSYIRLVCPVLDGPPRATQHYKSGSR